MKNKLRAFGRSLLLDVGLRGKLLCIFFLLLVLPLGAFTLYAFHRINTVIEEQTYSAAQKAFEDTHTAVEDLLGRLTQVADILAMDPPSTPWRPATPPTPATSSAWRTGTASLPPSPTCAPCPGWTGCGCM